METNDKIAQRVLKTVCEYFEQPIEQVTSNKRNQKYLVPRQIAMKLMRENTTLALADIGAYFKGSSKITGGRDHATVLHAIRKVDELKDWDYGSRTILGHLEVLRRKVQGEKAKEWPIQVRRYKYDYR